MILVTCWTNRNASLVFSSHGDVAQILEHSLCMREVPGSMPRISNFSKKKSPEIQNWTTRSRFVRQKEESDKYVQDPKGSIWNSTELAEEAIGAPNRHGYLRKTSKDTFLLHWWVNQRPPSDINSSFAPHQRGSSIERASDWHVRSTWIDDQHRQSQI